MAFDTTTTENNPDDASQSFVQGHGTSQEIEPDLAVEGLSDSLLSRLLSLLGIGR